MKAYFFHKIVLIAFGLVTVIGTNAQVYHSSSVVVGAEQVKQYLPLLKSRKVALAANQTSMVNQQHLADLLLEEGVQLQLVFSPEHGFRGNADAGEKVTNGIDTKTGLQLISLYGKHKKPTPEDLKGIDMVVFDIQDVGVRFYTYISTLHYIMEACAENYIPLLVLDRPNPNGFYVDGPILEKTASSFIGMHPIPLVHGMTIGEYALMLNEEGWLADSAHCDLMVVPCQNYTHKTLYELPVKPSPNLPNIRSIYLYPTLGLFEGTIVSIGRGTPFPFQVYGHPDIKKNGLEFTPKPMYGAKYPKLNGELCRGTDFRELSLIDIRKQGFTLRYLIEAFNLLHKDHEFFTNFFYRLVGSHTLRQQIENGMSEDEIKATWQEGLIDFKKTRKKYLLYEDFE